GVLELHRVKARTQPHDVPGMEGSHSSGTGLTSLHGPKPGAHEARKDAFRGHEGVLRTQALVGRGGEDCRCTGADGLEREPAVEVSTRVRANTRTSIGRADGRPSRR